MGVTVEVEPGTEAHFRYLGADGHWFDEPDADEITETGSLIRMPSTPSPAVSNSDAAKLNSAALESE